MYEFVQMATHWWICWGPPPPLTGLSEARPQTAPAPSEDRPSPTLPLRPGPTAIAADR